jgi:NAD(P)-dependent dehydrogenase (short-subunit alcohol dehydrogenase family)
MFFNQKIVWITGASSGIGRAMALRFAEDGARLILSSRDDGALRNVAMECADAGAGTCEVLLLDMVDEEALREAAAHVRVAYGQLDMLVHAAGVSQRSLVINTSQEVDLKIMQVNYFGVIWLTKYALELLEVTADSRIVVISSVSGKLGYYGRSAYSAAKHALHGFFEALRFELQERVKVTMICPGYVQTNLSVNALTGNGEKHGIIDANQQKGIPVTVAAGIIINAIKRGRRELIFGGREIMMWRLRRWCPTMFYLVGIKLGKKELPSLSGHRIQSADDTKDRLRKRSA